MTRPLTKRELVSVAAPNKLLAETDTFVQNYLIVSLGLGVVLSMMLAGLVFLTDALGLLSLIVKDRSPVEASITLVLTSVFAFAPIIFASAVGLLSARSDAAGSITAIENGGPCRKACDG